MVHRLADAIAAETDPVILAGDLNMTDRAAGYRMLGGPMHDAMRTGWWAASTYRHGMWRDLSLRIDHLFVPADWCAVDAKTFGVPGSDHRGIESTVGPVSRVGVVHPSRTMLVPCEPLREQPGPGQISVWDFPRPPALVADHRRVVVTFAGEVDRRDHRRPHGPGDLPPTNVVPAAVRRASRPAAAGRRRVLLRMEGRRLLRGRRGGRPHRRAGRVVLRRACRGVRAPARPCGVLRGPGPPRDRGRRRGRRPSPAGSTAAGSPPRSSGRSKGILAPAVGERTHGRAGHEARPSRCVYAREQVRVRAGSPARRPRHRACRSGPGPPSRACSRR